MTQYKRLLYILQLFPNFFKFGFNRNDSMGYVYLFRLGSDRVELTAKLLQQKIELSSGRFDGIDHFPELFDMTSYPDNLL